MCKFYENGKPTDIYRAFVSRVIDRFKGEQPRPYQSLSKILGDLDRGILDYDIIYSRVQSGKSIAISFLLWVITYKYRRQTIFMTKNLCSIRSDIMMKLTGLDSTMMRILNEVMREEEFGRFGEQDKRFFIPDVTQLKDIKCQDDYKLRQIPVFLMNSENYKALFKYVKFAENHKIEIVFIIDEYHAWITEQMKFVQKSGVTKISGLAILHWLHSLRQRGHCLIGVSATPMRVLADSHLYPKKEQITELQNDPPFPRAHYFGFISNDDPYFRPIEVRTYQPDSNFVMSIIKYIYDHRQTYGRQCPFILITTEYYNEDQIKMTEKINEHFKDCFVYAEYYNQESTTDLQSFFDRIDNLPNLDDYKKFGVFVLVANRTVDTGVTVKSQNPKQLDYLYGITDQIISKFKYLERDIQALRICGWYPFDHKSTLWVPDGYEDVYRTDMWSLINNVLKSYDGHPSSVKSIQSNNPKIKNILGLSNTDLYKYRSAEKHSQPEFQKTRPTNVLILETQIYKVGNNAQQFQNVKLADLYNKQRRQNELHKILGFQYNHKRKGLLISYNQSRQNQILMACFRPNNTNTQWQVDSFLYGPYAEQSLIKDTYIIHFRQSWQERLTMNNLPPNVQGLAFKIFEDLWCVCYKSAATLNHKYIQDIDFELSTDHHTIMEKIKNFKTPPDKTNPKTAWLFFRWLQCQRGENGGAKICSIHWKNPSLKKPLQDLFQQNIPHEEKVKLGLDICNNFFKQIP